MRIGIDVDGVLRDFSGDLETIIKKEFPQYIPGDIDSFKLDNWKLDECLTCTKKEVQEIYWYSHANEIMANGTPIYGAIKKMYDLFDWAEENGHSLVCITSQKPHARHYTLSWLGKYGLNPNQVIFEKSRFKWIHDIDYLIDDSPVNHKHWVENREDKDNFIVFNREYNKDVDSKYRINHLLDIKELI